MKITIVGLGIRGTSLALALQAAHEAITITGHDADPERAARAKRLGAIDRSEWNLPAACEKSGLVVLDLPLDETRRTLEAIAGVVTPEAVVVGLMTVTRPVAELVRQLLPHPERFVGGHLLLSPHAPADGEPSADKVRGATFYLVSQPGTTSGALDVATSLAVAAGTEPRYIDAAEHDGLAAATCQLPVVAAVGVAAALAADEGRQERIGASGRALAALGAALDEGADAAALLGNDANVLYWIDRYVVELARLRRLIADGDHGALTNALTEAAEAMARRATEELDGAEATTPKRGEGGWRELFLGGLGRGRPPG